MITETTKVKDWIKYINNIIEVLGVKNYSWDTVSESGVAVYKFDMKKYKQMPIDSKFIVTYAGVELDERDYVISGGDTLTFVSPSEESGCPIRVRFLRKNNEDNI